MAEVRKRAVQSIAEIPDGAATALLRDALANADVVVRRYAALALGTRGVADAVPTLIDMVVEETNDVDAADALSALASRPRDGGSDRHQARRPPRPRHRRSAGTSTADPGARGHPGDHGVTCPRGAVARRRPCRRADRDVHSQLRDAR